VQLPGAGESCAVLPSCSHSWFRRRWRACRLGDGARRELRPEAAKRSTTKTVAQPKSFLPKEIRGVHVTMMLASLKGKLAEYASLKSEGLNTIELDIKDENGTVAFSSPEAPLAGAVGAAGTTTTRPASLKSFTPGASI